MSRVLRICLLLAVLVLTASLGRIVTRQAFCAAPHGQRIVSAKVGSAAVQHRSQNNGSVELPLRVAQPCHITFTTPASVKI